ncbi:MAG: Cys-tRNA(Pro) deacylase [Sulfurimonas denitrificans]|jgi:Cys-tRNA(Pro)/Cys-tRNA(Cys) deacylase|nr:Cys-tRNA(Pro) deacylase [Sulfurimonas denitrificans]
MTPCIDLLKKSKIEYNVHHYTHDSSCDSYGDEAAEKLGISTQRVFKTLVVAIDTKELVVAVLPVSSKLSMKAVAKTFGAKKAAMADAHDVQKTTGYVLGGVSPIGQKKRLKTVIDSTARDYLSIFVSAGKRGLEVELRADDLKTLTNAKFEDIKSEQ